MSEQHAPRSYPPADPSGIEAPHDVLAAEEFGIGTREERWPADPRGEEPPHDVLAAEEFAMPAGTEAGGGQGHRVGALLTLVALGAATAWVLLLLLRRRASA
jgi:hypothetical protein